MISREIERFGYAKNGRAVVFALGETWTGSAGCPGDYQITWAREFRYDGARARYMNRSLNPGGLMANPIQIEDLGTVWSDYDGDEPYGDFTVNGTTAVDTNSYEPGLWRRLKQGTNFVTDYLHNDHLGTLRKTSDAGGVAGALRVFTAFGEKLNASPDRLGYVGAYGYETTLDPGATAFPFLHLGARYYDPSSGRFLQRDPIGIVGGRNVYAYVAGNPVTRVDAMGLIPHDNPMYDPLKPPKPPPPPSPRDIQKGAQWTATVCALLIGITPGGAAAATIIGGTVLFLDIVEYVGVLPEAPDTWDEALDWEGAGAG